MIRINIIRLLYFVCAFSASEIIEDAISVEGPKTIIDCSLNSDITFKLNRTHSNSSITLAECETTSEACFLMDKKLEENYAVAYTQNGGILNLTKADNETSGTYTCHQTHVPSVYVRTEIKPMHVYITVNTVTNMPCQTEEMTPYNIIVYAVLIQTCILIPFILLKDLISNKICRLVRCMVNKKAEAENKYSLNDSNSVNGNRFQNADTTNEEIWMHQLERMTSTDMRKILYKLSKTQPLSDCCRSSSRSVYSPTETDV